MRIELNSHAENFGCGVLLLLGLLIIASCCVLEHSEQCRTERSLSEQKGN